MKLRRGWFLCGMSHPWKWFCSLVKEMITSAAGCTVGLEGESDGDTLEHEYDHGANGERVVLGKGMYGIVYAGRDLSNQVRTAIKEIPERDSRQVGVGLPSVATSTPLIPGPPLTVQRHEEESIVSSKNLSFSCNKGDLPLFSACY